MKDYSMNLEERKDYILGYDITKDGQIKIRFAKGKPWYVPYNDNNEKTILNKMEQQLEDSGSIDKKLKERFVKYIKTFGITLGMSIFPYLFIVDGLDTTLAVTMSSVIAATSVIPGVMAIKNNSKIKDLRKNVAFLEMEDKLNEIVRSDQNILVDVSTKTKNAIKEFPEDRDVFNINSFNYIPFKDLEQIMDNASRNEKFGFNYEEKEEVKSFVKKRVR